MKANVVFFGEFSKANDIILAAIGEVDSRTHDLKKILVSLKHRAQSSVTWTMIVFELLKKDSVMLIIKAENAYMARRTRFKSTWRVLKLTGIQWSLTLKYAAALSNVAWADAGTTLWATNQHFQRICEMKLDRSIHFRL